MSQGQAYPALRRRLLARRNCFVRLGYEKVQLKAGIRVRKPKKDVRSRKKEARTQQPESRRRKATGSKKKAESRKPQAAATKRKPAVPKRKALKMARLDLSKFPAESVTQMERGICLACVWEVFTRHLKLAPQTALGEIRRYTPSLEELNAAAVARPYVAAQSYKEPCPYCRAASKWIARLPIYRIESGKATDALRRDLVKSLSKKDDSFVVLEQKATQQHAFFEWLELISKQLDLDDSRWIREVSRHYLARKEPKVDWQAEFGRAHSIRRSRRLEEGWEADNGRLFLAPMLFDELLLVQYLVSRSHLAGGLTLEGRYTLPELFYRLRHSGYLRVVGVQAGNPGDALEQLLAHLSGGEAALRFYYIIDRRELLAGAKALKVGKATGAAK
jgi:hypothetical protein